MQLKNWYNMARRERSSIKLLTEVRMRSFRDIDEKVSIELMFSYMGNGFLFLERVIQIPIFGDS